MSPFKKENKRQTVFTRRALLMGGGQLAVLGVLAAKLYEVQVTEGERYATLAESNRISARLTSPTRGRILDRFGTVVGGNRLNYRALFTAEQSDDVDQTLDSFAKVVDLPDHERARLDRELRRRRRFVPIIVREFLSGTWRRPTTRTWRRTRCWRCRASGWAGRGWRRRRTWRCGARRGPCRWRSTRWAA